MMMKIYKLLLGITIISLTNIVQAQTKIASISDDNVSTIKKHVTRIKSTNNIRRKHNSIPDEAGNINNNDMLY